MVISLEKTIENKVSNFINTITTSEEISGLFNLAMRGLNRLLKQDGFSYKNSGIDTKLKMMQSNSISRFAMEACYKDVGKEISKEEFYEAYVVFCDTKGISPETIAMVGRRLPFCANYVTDVQMTGFRDSRVAQVKGWRNISLHKTPEQIKELEDNNKYVEELTKIKHEPEF